MITENKIVAEVRFIELEEIRASKTNPRKRFDEVALAELKASIADKGLVSPLLVRPIEPEPGAAGLPPRVYELVAGERRFRCCTALGIDRVPCLVRTLTDQQALELQIIENLQRDDLDPIEEAEGYEKLIEMGEYDAKALAEKVNKTSRYIYQRLKLLFLPDEARKALLDGRLPLGHAREIACLPHEDWRNEAARIVLDPKGCKIPDIQSHYWNHPKNETLSYSETTELLTTRYMHELKTAPFDQKDPTLNPVQGACTDCPKRAGNSPDLFPHLRGDMCTDLKCYGVKQEAVRLRLVQEATGKGQKVLSETERKKVMYDNGQLNYGSAYVKLDEEPSYSEVADGVTKRPKWHKLIAGQDVPIVLAIDEAGHVHKLVDHKLALEAAKRTKPEIFRQRGTSAGSASGKKEIEKRKRDQEVEDEVFSDVMDAVALKIEKTEKPSEIFAGAFLAYALDLSGEGYRSEETYRRLLERRHFDYVGDEKKAMTEYMKSLGSPGSKLAFGLELLLTHDEESGEGAGNVIFANAYKIDRVKIRAQVKIVIAEKAKAAAELAKKRAVELKAKAKKKPGEADATKPDKALELEVAISEQLIAAGDGGLTVKELSTKLKLSIGKLQSWFHTAGKKHVPAIKKVGEAKYAIAIEKAMAA